MLITAIFLFVPVLLDSQQRISIKLCTKPKLCNEANPPWWQFASSKASREWTGIFRTNTMWRQFFTWSHSALFRWPDDIPEERTSKPKRFDQQEINDHIQDLSLSKDKAELLASGLKERNLLQSDVRICHCQIWDDVLKTFCRVYRPMVFCHDINGHFLRDWNKNITHQIGSFSLQWKCKAPPSP